MYRLISGALIGICFAFLSGCISTTANIKADMVGTAGSIERRTGHETVREAYTGGGYSYESTRGDRSFRMIQATGVGREHQTEAQDFQKALSGLADQLLHGLNRAGHAESQIVLLSTTFANLDDLAKTSTFGRYTAEQLSGELRNREFSVIEPRRSKELMILPRTGELALSREIQEIFTSYKANTLLTGTYTVTAQQVALSVRLVLARTNSVLASGTIFFDRRNNLFINSLLLREAVKVATEEKHRPRALVPVSNRYVRNGGVVESDLAPTKGRKPLRRKKR